MNRAARTYSFLPELLSKNIELKMIRKVQEMADSERGREEKGN